MNAIEKIQAQLPSSKMQDKYRKPLRFLILGTIGTFVQTGVFMAAMVCLSQPEKNTVLYYVAFGIGFVVEMVLNYFFSNWYTFGTSPNIRNAGGFVLARAINLVLQFSILPFLVHWLPTWDNDYLSYLCIFIAGIVNYFILLFFFKKDN